MAEQFANLASSTLASAYSAGSGSISVVSAAPFPTSGTFTLVIRDQATKAIKLLFRVASVSGTTFTGAAEGTDAAANAGDLVDGTMVSVAMLAQFKADILASVPSSGIANGFGTLASRPVSGNIGDRYVASDSVFDEYRWNGASWDAFVAGMKCSNPVAGQFTLAKKSTNATQDSFSTVNGALKLMGHVSAGDNLILQLQAYPAVTPFKYRIRFRMSVFGFTFNTWGLAVYDNNTDKAINFGITPRGAPFSYVAYSWNTVSSGAASFYGSTGPIPTTWANRGGIFEVQIQDDGTNRTIWVSDDGQNPLQVDTHLNSDFITPTHIGISLMPYATATNKEFMTILDCGTF